MINHLSLLIAVRYLIGTRHDKNISLMLIICFIGIFIGAFSLGLIISIMTGFEVATYEKLQGIHAHIIIRAPDRQLLNTKPIEEILEDEFPEIASYSPSITQQAIIQQINSDDISNVIALKAIDPSKEQSSTTLSSKIIEPVTTKPNLHALLHNNGILIGNKLAEILELKVGDPVNLLFAEEGTRGRKVTLSQQEAVITGIFSTGIEEFDSALAVCTIPFLNKLFPAAQPSQINIHLKPGANEAAVLKSMQQQFEGLEVFSWKDLYPALVAALKLEKYAMFFILSLITLVASMNIISLLFMYIVKKRPDIAIYRAMGMSTALISHIFLYIGLSIALVATVLGLLTAMLVALLLQHYPFISLPDSYLVTTLPAVVEWQSFVAIFVVIMAMSVLATWIPVRRIGQINIARTLRFEA